RKKAEDATMPLGTQASGKFIDLVRVLEVDGVDLESLGAGRCNDEAACVMHAQLDVFLDGGALAASEAMRATVSFYLFRDGWGKRQVRDEDRLRKSGWNGRHRSAALDCAVSTLQPAHRLPRVGGQRVALVAGHLLVALHRQRPVAQRLVRLPQLEPGA